MLYWYQVRVNSHKIVWLIATLVLLDLDEQTKGVYQRMSSFLPAAASIEPEKDEDGDHELHFTWLSPLKWLIARERSGEEAFATFLRADGLPLLERLLKEHVQGGRSRTIRECLSEAQVKLTKSHEAMLRTIKVHELGWAHRLRLYAASSAAEEERELSEALQANDLFLSEQHLRHAAARFLAEKEEFIQVLQEQFHSLQELERALVDELRPLLMNLLRIKEQQAAPVVAERINELINTLRSLDTSLDWQEAQRRHRLDWDWSLTVPPVDGLVASILTQTGLSLSPEAASPTVRPIRIMKSGYLMRPPVGAFSRSWSVVFCVLCDSAYLHCYQPETLKQQHHQQQKQRQHQQQSTQDSVRIPPHSMNLHRRGLVEVNATAAKAWLPASPEEQVPGMPELLSHPLFSIPFLHPGTLISPEASRSGDKHVFTVTIPGSSSLFGRSERKYQLRSFVEEDMVDWCIAIKETMALVQSLHCQPAVPRREEASVSQETAPKAANMGYLMEGLALDEVDELRAVSNTVPTIEALPLQEEEPAQYPGRVSTPTTPIAEVENPWE